MKNITTAAAAKTANATQSKSDQALAIFTKLHGKKTRKEIVQEFVDRVGLTPSSASTYYQKFSGGTGGTGSRRTTSAKGASGSSGRGRRPDESSKAGICRAIFKRLGAKKPRKDVLQAFIQEAELTPAGASTYYQKLRHAA